MREFDIRDHVPGPAGMLGAAANVIMQLGLPGVGYGVVESRVDSGNVLLHPWKRLRTTLSFLAVALMGSERDRVAVREAINRSHRLVRSGPSSPVPYSAFDPELQRWVAACLYVGLRDLREAFLGPLDRDEAEALLAYSSRLGTTLQMPDDAWPSDLREFEAYWQDGLARVRYDAPVREHLLKVVDLRMVPGWMRLGTASANRHFTVGFLPPQVREAMGLAWTESDQRRFDRWVARLRLVTRLTPRWARVLPVQLQIWEVRMRVRLGWSIT